MNYFSPFSQIKGYVFFIFLKNSCFSNFYFFFKKKEVLGISHKDQIQ